MIARIVADVVHDSDDAPVNVLVLRAGCGTHHDAIARRIVVVVPVPARHRD